MIFFFQSNSINTIEKQKKIKFLKYFYYFHIQDILSYSKIKI